MNPFAALTMAARWVAWRNEQRGQSVAKVPYSPHGGSAKTDDPSTWGTHQEAEAQAKKLSNGRGGGVGIVLGDLGSDSYLAGFDLDSCIEEGMVAPWAAAILSVAHTYAEISPSGHGLKDIAPEFDRFGIEIINFNVVRISIPEDEQRRFQEILGRRMEIDQISQARLGQPYTTMRTFDTLEEAAKNEGGNAGQLLGAGLGLGVGLGAAAPLGQQVGSAMSIQPSPQTPQNDAFAKLQTLKQMLDAGLITQDEFDQKKREILDSM